MLAIIIILNFRHFYIGRSKSVKDKTDVGKWL